MADFIPGSIHSVLPAIQTEFTLNIILGGIFLGAFNFASNWVQVFTGHLRAERTRPLYMYLGLMLGAAICLLAVLPRATSSFSLMVVLALIGGSGVAIIHPEALRAVHALDRISSSTSTAVFMIGGILGFALGGKYSTQLVTYFGGVRGLFPLAVLPIFCILSLMFLKVPLAVEPRRVRGQAVSVGAAQLPFWPIMAMAALAGISTSTVVWIVPLRLKELGFELTFGGYTVMMFSLGAGAGAFFWATLARHMQQIACAMTSLLLGIPLLIAYALTAAHRPAAWLLFGASFCAFGSFPLMVSIARGASGPRLGQRMGLMVGGTWGIASLFPMFLAPAADTFGKHAILLWSWIGYALAVAAGGYLLLSMRRPADVKELHALCQ
ncbi:MAG: hypothetical protein IH624_15845 [Phycisphaerae bacterium]|nr:hypothetical protein [Phycisphaerae bacterium]